MANPGYGKRDAPDQLPRTAHDFAHLPPREAAVAAYIDRLPGGADISVKTLAKTLPYGQCALRTALNNLQRAGHLRRGREHLADSGSARWITRTWFSRTARDDDWWAAFTRGDVPKESPEPETPVRQGGPTRSRAYILLAALGRTAPALSLSARACEDLAPLVTEWFARGASDEHVLQSLTAGLPTPVHSPTALVRRRLTTKLPPEPEPESEPVQEPAPRPPLRVLECAKCGTPGRPEALPGGICGLCRGEAGPARHSTPLTSTAVHAHAAAARAAMVDRRERPRV
ncbi:hypothetical protein [Streptomyces sp. NBC_00878]|uniref:hypothetical protein n=1 Tax=Streptomyces sp. NBC_00878 TaxID=2975854 RepID=UPI00225218EB|nr:hypothetical protein [Streptomyces sp. NBC_00878]MCX4906602.1 hypothetical protein [Streptomyces sp. NBC_00878]